MQLYYGYPPRYWSLHVDGPWLPVESRYTTPHVPVRERVKDLRVPTLLVCGERETRFMPNRAFAEHTIPGLQVVGANVGHAVNSEAAETFNTAVVDFLSRPL